MKNLCLAPLACAALLLLGACGGKDSGVGSLNTEGQAASVPSTRNGQITQIADVAILREGEPVSSELGRLLRAPALGARELPVGDLLPGLAELAANTRNSSALVDEWSNGADFSAKSLDAVVQASALALTPAAGGTSWAVYALDAPSAFQLRQLKVEVSNTSFSGSNAGYWVLVANYTTGRWQSLGRSSAAAFAAALTAEADYISPGGKVFAAVVLMGPQSMSLNRVGLNIDDTPWQSLELAAGPFSGVTPAIDFTPGGNPAVAWSNSNDGKVRFAICDRPAGFSNPASWTVSVAENDPASASVNEAPPQTVSSPSAKAKWLDLVIDPDVSMPRISLLYTDLAGTLGNCRIGCTALADPPGPTGLTWLNYRLGFTDSAFSTSLARDPSDFSYDLALTAGNQNRSGGSAPNNRFVNDMELRRIVWQTPVLEGRMGPGSLSFGHGEQWTYPHLRVHSSGNASVAVNGGRAFQLADATPDVFLDEANSGVLGSLVFAPDNSPGMTFCFTGVAGQQALRYQDFNASFVGTGQSDIETLANAAANALAEVSQLGYLPNGKACIAYTHKTAAGVAIKFALQTDADWQIETVSKTNGTPANAGEMVFLDMALDAAGIPAICWTQWSGSSSSMMVALRGS